MQIYKENTPVKDTKELMIFKIMENIFIFCLHELTGHSILAFKKMTHQDIYVHSKNKTCTKRTVPQKRPNYFILLAGKDLQLRVVFIYLTLPITNTNRPGYHNSKKKQLLWTLNI